MAQIRKGFIASNAIDGTKLKLLNNEAVRAANADGTDAELMKLDSSNVLQFLKLPQVSADPSAANDVARKGYVDTTVNTAKGDLQDAINAEQSARESADSGLQSAIDTEVSDRTAAVSAEASARQAADEGLQDAIDVEKGRIDAILSAATADADSFAEIVSLINSVDTENDTAFASYVLSNDAALAQEVSDRQSADSTLQSNIDSEASTRASAVSAEASARQSADTTLQSNIDAEASARASAVSSEASARQTADAALQSAIDALTVDDMTDVSTASKTDGDLFQWDGSQGKWVNVAPLSEASTSTVVVPGSETLLSSYTNTPNYNDGSGVALGTTYRPTSNVTISKVGLKMGRSSNLTQTVTAKIYQVATHVITSNNFNYNPADFTLLATSTNSLSPSDFALYPASAEMEYWTFDNVALSQDGYYLIWAEVDGATFGAPSTNYLAPSYAVGNFPDNHYKQFQQNGQVGGDYNLALGYEIYTGSAGSSSEVAEVGVIKTNSSGMLDDSFIDVTIARSSDLEAETAAREAADSTLQSNLDSEAATRSAADSTLQSNLDSETSARQSADSTLQSNIDSEVSARQAAVSAEQSAREAGDASLQSQIDALDSGSSAGLAQEISDRQAGDSALQSAIDTEKGRIDAILSASTADKDSFAEIVNLINSVDTENDAAFASYVLSNDAALAQEVSDRQSGDSTLQSNIDSEASARQAADSAETAAREAADTALQGEVDAVEASVAQEVSDRTAAVSAEQSAREAADQSLQSSIDALDSSTSAAMAQEVSDRTAADSAEQAAREAADGVLQGNIDSEAAARSAADTTLQGNIDAEQAAREAADDAMDVRVDALEAIAHRKDKFTLTSTDISNGYVDLSMECIVDSEMVFVGALYLHSTDHYTVSTVGGVTRLTWAGDMVVGGTSELVAGDVIYVRYMK